MSADGSIQTAVASYAQIYVSTDYGNTWTAKESNRQWNAVAMSADGSIQTAGIWGGQIYVSTDYGNNWTAKESTRYWYSVAMSADGSIQTAVASYGQIYVSSGGGNLGIGTMNPSAKLEVAGDAKITGNLYAGSGPTVLFVDDTNDRVGIGTASPNEVLDVNGTVKANSFKGVPWRSPQWVIANAGSGAQGYFPPAGSSYGFYNYTLPFDVTIEGFVVSADSEANDNDFVFQLWVNGYYNRNTFTENLTDDESSIVDLQFAADLSAGTVITVKYGVGNGAAEIACWLYGRTNE
jgi:hypothetical protein